MVQGVRHSHLFLFGGTPRHPRDAWPVWQWDDDWL